MTSLSTKGALEAAAIEVCDAIRRHAKICQEEAKNVSAVVRAGEDLTRAVLNYEVTLRAISGWSNPIRHLGPLPLFGDRLHRDGSTPDTRRSSTPDGRSRAPHAEPDQIRRECLPLSSYP